MDKYSGGNHSHHHRHFPCRKNTITCIYVDATKLFIKAQNHSLHGLKNSIIHFFFKETFMQKGASVDLRQQTFCFTNAAKQQTSRVQESQNHTSSTLLAYVAGGIAMIAVALYLKMLDFQKDVVPCISYGKKSLPWVIEIFFFSYAPA